MTTCSMIILSILFIAIFMAGFLCGWFTHAILIMNDSGYDEFIEEAAAAKAEYKKLHDKLDEEIKKREVKERSQSWLED